MRNTVLSILFFSLFAMLTCAQNTRSGATAGFLNSGVKISDGTNSATNEEAGFYLGLFADFEFSDSFFVQPEFLYANVDGASALFVPVLAKYYLFKGFSIQAGPQLGISLEETGSEIGTVSVEVAGGLAYDISDTFFVEARYAQQLNNSYTGDIDDFTIRGNGLFIGLGCRFN